MTQGSITGRATRGGIRRRRPGAAVVALAVVAMGLSACVGIPPLPAEGPDPNDAPRAGDAAYATAGPYDVGVRTVDLSDREMEVWYPAPAGSAGDVERDAYFIRDFVPGWLDELIPEDVNPPFVTDAVRDLPVAADGPFPLVIFSHGFASYRQQSTFLTTHLASWGFVVISTDYLNRGLRSVLGDAPPTTRSDLDVADEAIAAARTLTNDARGPLGGAIAADDVLAVGHSAGGALSLALLSRPDVTTAIPLAMGLNLLSAHETIPLLTPDTNVTWIAGVGDAIVPLDGVRLGFDYTAGQRRIIELGGSGHVNAFSEICEIGDGGAAGLARSIGLPVPDSLLALGDDGCRPPAKPSAEVWPEVRHFVTAELRYRAGLDPEPVGLGDAVLERFDDVVRYSHNP